MQSFIRIAVLLALGFAVPMTAVGQDVNLTSDGKVPGQPFQVLQLQINDLQAQLSALQSRADALEAQDVNLQGQIDYLQAQIDQLQIDLANIELTPGPVGPPGPQGPAGVSQNAGQVCAEGEAVIGFDANGDILCAGVGGVGAGLALYDSFSGTVLDESKWSPEVGSDCALSVLGGVLITNQAFSGTTSNCGVSFTDPLAVADFSAEITVQNYIEEPGSNIRARLFGSYFNANVGGAAPLSRVGDVFAVIQAKDFVLVDQGGIMETVGFVQWVVGKCTAVDCSTQTIFGAGPVGSIRLGETHTMRLAWNGNTAFTFQLDDDPVITHDVFQMNEHSNTDLPGVPDKHVMGRGTGNPFGMQDVEWDNVRCETLDGAPCPHP